MESGNCSNKYSDVTGSDEDRARCLALDHLIREGLAEMVAFELRRRKKKSASQGTRGFHAEGVIPAKGLR